MKYLKILSLISICYLFQACWYNNNDDDIIEPIFQSQYSPIIMERDAFESSTSLEASREIIEAGKIYVKDQYLFIGEKNQGFHVFDNTNPENPMNIGFLKILGASDLAIKNDIIYANNAVDLIAIQTDLSTSTLTITKRIENTFPQLNAPDGSQYYNLGDNQIIVDWILNN